MTLDDLTPALKYNRLNVRQLAIVLLLADQKERQVREVAQALGISKPSVSRCYDALANLGLLTRVREVGDKRNVIASLTKNGREFATEIKRNGS